MSDASFRRCYEQVQQCIASKNSIRRLLTALESSGCRFNLDRHVACEPNQSSDQHVRGGFDQTTCQIVLYPERMHSLGEFCTILQHELVHALDYCRVHLDFKNPFHLACTEIRAAALSDQCSLFQHVSTSSRPYRWKNQHANCVKNRTKQSMEICTDLPRARIDEIIDDVFPRCYRDTDPFDG